MTDFEKFWEPIASNWSATSAFKELAKMAFEAGKQSVWVYINNDVTEKNKQIIPQYNDWGGTKDKP